MRELKEEDTFSILQIVAFQTSFRAKFCFQFVLYEFKSEVNSFYYSKISRFSKENVKKAVFASKIP